MIRSKHRTTRTALVALLLAIAVGLLATVATGSSGATGSSEATQAKYTIGLVVNDLGNEFHTRVANAAKKAASARDVELVVLDSKRDTAKEADAIDQLITRQVDMILVLCTSAKGTPAALNRAIKAGIPVMTVVDSCEGSGTKYRYVGNDFASGAGSTPQAEQLAKLLKGKGNLVYIKGDPGSAVAIKREKAFKAVIKKHPGMTFGFDQHGDWLEPSGQRLMEDAITRFPEKGSIAGVAAHDDLMAVGAGRALKRAGRLGEVVIAGLDGTKYGLTAMVNGLLTFTVFNDAEAGGRLGVTKAVEILDGKKVPKLVNIPWVAVTTKAQARALLKQRYGAK